MGKKLSFQEAAAIAADYERGDAISVILKRYGRKSKSSIKSACARFGVPMRSPGRRPAHGDDVLREIRRLRLEGATQAEIKDSLGVTQHVVERAVNEAIAADHAAGYGREEIANRNRVDEERVRSVLEGDDNSKVVAEPDPSISRQLDAAIERDRAWLDELDRRRELRMAA